ncbi:MAG TPA: hypothetical protein VH280_01570 [Verrucomicrobiae bacterium]|jgi:hypothetical protein|nr:hypothetical protein [Verrucomicrobiae bacterium]
MKSDTLNGVLTFVLGVLVVLGVICVLRVVIITHELRSLQSREVMDHNVMLQTQAVYADAATYNKQYRDPELARILQSIVKQPATGTPATAPANH